MGLVSDADGPKAGRLMATREETREKWITFADAIITLDGSPGEAARIAGYKGKKATLAATASRLLAHEEVQEIIAQRREALKAEGNLPATKHEQIREHLAIGREDKRQFLWSLANECARTIRTEDIAEHIDEDGATVRTITVTESVFKPREAIEAIAKLNEMDGDIMPPNVPPGGGGGGLSIEQLLLSITQNNH